ncbi:helix-turn-helix domain-containing protein [Wolbachia endosymbiont of Folsomia candida]|uniref:helix-turn-helix domain-containing protein n=1 Tax=Wolbachia endosymbiont of Folsomia candida TaxID=169402 RepID=UPI000AFECD02|nr:helix-turn-helix transcriptional regulator [Wolbachia endosymbiont of Folsomia candida]APR98675.1 XRE family transcriptional regulator [Wolbachia endosymbiont of Folsomia candida]
MSISKLKNDFSHTQESTDTGCHKMGRKVKELRLIQGLTQEGLGDKVGVSFQQIQKYESGKNAISIDKLLALAQALSVDLAVLLPTPIALHEESSFEHKDDESSREILELVREYKEIKSQESRKAVRSLVRSLSSSQ